MLLYLTCTDRKYYQALFDDAKSITTWVYCSGSYAHCSIRVCCNAGKLEDTQKDFEGLGKTFEAFDSLDTALEL